jgi:hypothetical protein
MAEAPTTIRLAPAIRQAVQEFASEMGISFNAALSVLLAEAIKARRGGIANAASRLP